MFSSVRFWMGCSGMPVMNTLVGGMSLGVLWLVALTLRMVTSRRTPGSFVVSPARNVFSRAPWRTKMGTPVFSIMMSEMTTSLRVPPSTHRILMPPLRLSRMAQSLMRICSNPPYDSVPSLMAAWPDFSRSPLAVMFLVGLPLVDFRTSASSPLSTSQLVIVKSSEESMLMPSLCGTPRLSIVTFSIRTFLHWK